VQIASKKILLVNYYASILLKYLFMKKLLLSLSAITLCSSLFAQTNKVEKALNDYRFGLFVSTGISWLKPSSSTASINAFDYDVTKTNNKTAFAFGLSAEKVLNERYSIYSGLSLDWMGGGINSTATTPINIADSAYTKIADMKYNLQYLQIPLGLKLKATNIDKFQIFGQIGMDLGFMIGRKANYNITSVTNKVIAKDGEKLGISTMNPVNLGFQVGLGTEFEVTKTNSAYVTILYHNGFLDHTLPGGRTAAEGKFADGNVRGNNVSLRIGYYF
jgi:opacity protein-like surface antigen